MSNHETGTRGNSIKIQKRHARLNGKTPSPTGLCLSGIDFLVCAITVNTFKNEVDDVLSTWCNKLTYGLS